MADPDPTDSRIERELPTGFASTPQKEDPGRTLEDSESIITSDVGELPALKFPVMALGASAGGLEAFRRVLENLSSDLGLAVLLIQHLSPQHPSMLSSILSHATAMSVVEVTHGTPVEPNRVFVIPPNKLMTISGGVLELAPRPENSGASKPIDHFFRSLARDQKTGAIGVVLSGTDGDGALGLQAIREEGGIVIVQREDTAEFAGMPHSAAAAGPIDLILTPEEIGQEVGRIVSGWPSSQLQITNETQSVNLEDSEEDFINRILAAVGKAAGIDFRGYKRHTLRRRIERRMLLKREIDLKGYTALVEENHLELTALCDDFLINVTSFFRNPDSFVALGRKIVPELLKVKAPHIPLRVWVPGCSTGEEVYSLAICLLEATSKLSSAIPMQFFGTDLSERALAEARKGIFQEGQLSSLSAERRQQFFVPIPSGFQIIKSVRELCVFARQNVCFDPPFSRVDLISCRNLLIYLGPDLQRNVVATFHYGLRPGGFLMLGSSENLRAFPELFTVIDKQHKLFRRSNLDTPSSAMVRRGFVNEQGGVSGPMSLANTSSGNPSLSRTAERIVLREYGPPWLLVNRDFQILHASGDTSRFLRLPTGPPTFDLLKMARENLRGELRKLLLKARDEAFVNQSAVVAELIDGEFHRIGLRVWRVPDPAPARTSILVVFLLLSDAPGAQTNPLAGELSPAQTERGTETDVLRQELAVTSDRLQTIIDERDASNQELTSANEEIQSSNEELQSINEELETAKEELQSSNEELTTVNEELQHRNGELSHINDDLSNLMGSTTIPILLLDDHLRIRRMTAISESLLGLRSSDIGRSIGDIRMRLSIEDIESLARSVLATLSPQEMEIQDRDGGWRQLRLRPYRTADNRIEGVVLILIDIDQLRRAKVEAVTAREFAESVIQAVRSPLLVLGRDLRIKLVNRAFYREYDLRPAEVENQSFMEISRREWDLPGLRTAMADALEHPEAFRELEFEGEFAGRGKKSVCIYVRTVQPDGERLILILIEDVTVQRRAIRILDAREEELKSSLAAGTAALRESESALIRSREELRELAASLLNAQEAERRRISRDLHDDLSQKVARLQFDIDTLEQKLLSTNVEQSKRALRLVRDQTGALADDLRRVAHGLHPSSLDHLGLTVALRSYIEEFSRSTGITVEFKSVEVPRGLSMAVSICFYRIVQEALRNVAKHTPDSLVQVILFATATKLLLSIQDDGEGFDIAQTRLTNGLGLISMQERVRLVHGEFALQTNPGDGVQIVITVPLDQGEM